MRVIHRLQACVRVQQQLLPPKLAGYGQTVIAESLTMPSSLQSRLPSVTSSLIALRVSCELD